jgi:hypothetical protein
MKHLQIFESYVDINEAEKGLMHRILKLPKDKKITDVYTSGEDLAKAMLTGVKKAKIVKKKDVRKKATSMLAFAANWPGSGGRDVIDKALTAIKTLDVPGVPISTSNK